ncbi:MAG: Adenylyl cyclase CyaB [Candidatus Moranbacteria bacterium GW2011_GWD2_36_12]|nr:MAG: Adenylyl cyclase CyaB [Candidatus Moranbacteria bacterium GW2011_GWD2_36_12]KKQ07070.1 MAG: Adenylyl cyclase CyaB [Candidatus Moranbacteria bacterium GW2011_GWE2_36_40]
MEQKNIETEIRSLITEEQYKTLLKFFKKEGKFLGKENQISYYFSGEQDLRIQKSDKSAKIWLKKGKMHADCREEIEVKFDLKEFENAEKLFESLGYEVKIKWFRKRNTFLWKGISVMLDDTKGYGRIIELEKMCKEMEKEKTINMLRAKMEFLKIEETKKDEFEKKFEYYKKNWKKIV